MEKKGKLLRADLNHLLKARLPAIGRQERSLLVDELHHRLQTERYQREKALSPEKKRENHLMITALKAGLDPEAVKSLRTDLASNPDWTYIRIKAVQHLIAPLLLRSLAPLMEEKNFPGDWADTFEKQAGHFQREEEIFSRQVDTILDQAGSRNIEVCLLKGAALKKTVYAEPHLRPANDIDLLVHPEDLDRLGGIMDDLGFIHQQKKHEVHPSNVHRIFIPKFTTAGPNGRLKSALPVEVHWHIVGHAGTFRFRAEDLWQRSCPVPGFQSSVAMLCPEDQLIHLSLHCVFSHGFKLELLHYYDFAALLEAYKGSMEWDHLLRLCGQYRMGHVVYAALRICREIFGMENVPAEVMKRFRKHASYPQLRWLDSLKRDDMIENYISTKQARDPRIKRLIWIKGLKARIDFLVSIFFPPRTLMAQGHDVDQNSPKIFLCYVRHIFGLLAEHGGRFTGMLRILFRRTAGKIS